MRLNQIFNLLFALGATTFAAAGAVDIATTVEQVAVDVAPDRVTALDEDMAGFLAIVTDALADTHEATPPATTANVPAMAGGHRHDHLGLGFADTPIVDTTIVQSGDDCRGNGHSGAFGSGFGYRDCGDPSPSD